MSDSHKVWASSFADPDDIRAFRRCKAQGKTDKQCFEVGDNGIGFWGDDVSEGSGPACALPPEVIDYFGLGHNSPLIVAHNDKEATVLVRDHMPHLSYLESHNRKYRIDLNPDACHALGISIPAEAQVIWRKA